MAEEHEPQGQPDDAAMPVPNRRERRGKKSGTQTSYSSKSGAGNRSAQATPSRQYSTRRRSG